MKKGMVGAIAGVLALLMVLIGCEGLVTSNVDAQDDNNSTHYYVDLVPAGDIPVVEDLNNGNKNSETSYALAEAFNKYSAVYYVGNGKVTVPAGKTLYIAPGSAVSGFFVASEVSKGNTSRAGVSTGAGAAKIVVLEGATMPLDGTSTLGGLLQVNVGGYITKAPSAGTTSITGAGRVVVGGRVSIDTINVAGDVYVARGNGTQHGLIAANIYTTYLALLTQTPDADGRLDSSSREDKDFYAFETVVSEASRNVRVDGAVWGNIYSGGDVYVAENSRVTGLNDFYGYVYGNIMTYGKAEVLGNVAGSVRAKNAVTVGSSLTPPHRAQVNGSIYSRTGNVLIKPRANSGNIVAYRGSVTIEEGAAATGIDTYYNDSSYNNSQYDGAADLVNHGNVIVKGRVAGSISDDLAGSLSTGSGNIYSGGTVEVELYNNPKAAWSDFGPNGYVYGDVEARYSAQIDGVVAGDLDTYNYAFGNDDGTSTQTQNVTVNGVVGGHVTAGGTLTVADHHTVDTNKNPGISISSTYANGYVGGGASVYSRHGTGPSVINGYVEDGSFYVGSPATVTIASTGRVNTFSSYSSNDVRVNGTLAIDAGGELDANEIDDIYISNGSNSGNLTDSHVFAHRSSLADGGRLGPTWSRITIASGAKLYTQTPLVSSSVTLADREADFRDLAASQIIHTNVAPAIASLGIYASGPLALTVREYNGVTLTSNTTITGTIAVNGMLALGSYEFTLNGAGTVTLGADNNPLFNYDTSSSDYINGSISFEGTGSSLRFNSATAALNGLSSPSSYRPSGSPVNNQTPVVTGVESSSSGGGSGTVAAFTLPVSVTAAPSGNFIPGAGTVLMASGYSSYRNYISKTSRFVWTYSTYTP